MVLEHSVLTNGTVYLSIYASVGWSVIEQLMDIAFSHLSLLSPEMRLIVVDLRQSPSVNIRMLNLATAMLNDRDIRIRVITKSPELAESLSGLGLDVYPSLALALE